jgi:hypothetical protein
MCQVGMVSRRGVDGWLCAIWCRIKTAPEAVTLAAARRVGGGARGLTAGCAARRVGCGAADMDTAEKSAGSASVDDAHPILSDSTRRARCVRW